MSMAMYLDQWLAKQSRSFVWPEKVNHEQNFWPSQTNVDCCSVFILTDDERGKVHGKQQIVFCEPQKAVGWDVALDAVSVQCAHITAYCVLMMMVWRCCTQASLGTFLRCVHLIFVYILLRCFFVPFFFLFAMYVMCLYWMGVAYALRCSTYLKWCSR